MLAQSRIERVKGRIKSLIVSITIINGINKVGVPRGTKWAIVFVGFTKIPYTFNASQIGRARLRDSVIWLETVKLYLSKPNTLQLTTNKKMLLKSSRHRPLEIPVTTLKSLQIFLINPQKNSPAPEDTR